MPGDLAPPQGGGGAFLRHHHTTGLTLACRCLHRYIPDPSLKRQTPRATGSPNLDLGITILPSPFAQPFECPSRPSSS